MADVFISYCRTDRQLVLPLVENLKELGIDIWFDAVLHNGSDFSDEINEELKTAKAILVCWSEHAVASHWVKAEAHIGLEHNKLAACFFTPCTLGTPFNIVQTDNLKDWKGDWDDPGFLSLMDRIGTLVGRPGVRELCAAQADATGGRLASWASSFADDPAAAWVWPIWERRQRDDFRKSVEEVRQAIIERSKLQLGKSAAKLSSAERDFETWLARGKDAIGHRRPDPTTILRAHSDDMPGSVAAAQAARPARASRRQAAAFTASVAAALLTGGGLTWFVTKATTPADAGPTSAAQAKIVQLETQLKEAVNQSDLEAQSARRQVSDLDERLKRADLSVVEAKRDLQSSKVERDRAETKYKAILETLALSAVKTYYRLHEYDKAKTNSADVSRALARIYPESFEKKGKVATRDKHLQELESYYGDVDDLKFDILDRKLDFSGCIDPTNCRVKGYGQATLVRKGASKPEEWPLNFTLVFALGDPIRVKSECANSHLCD